MFEAALGENEATPLLHNKKRAKNVLKPMKELVKKLLLCGWKLSKQMKCWRCVEETWG